jgi:hypothetical protein
MWEEVGSIVSQREERKRREGVRGGVGGGRETDRERERERERDLREHHLRFHQPLPFSALL